MNTVGSLQAGSRKLERIEALESKIAQHERLIDVMGRDLGNVRLEHQKMTARIATLESKVSALSMYHQHRAVAAGQGKEIQPLYTQPALPP